MTHAQTPPVPSDVHDRPLWSTPVIELVELSETQNSGADMADPSVSLGPALS